LRGIFFIPFVVFSELLFFGRCAKRKEAKERRLIIVDFYFDDCDDIFYFSKFADKNFR